MDKLTSKTGRPLRMPDITEQQLATMLAALRAWQRHLKLGEVLSPADQEHFQQFRPLSLSQIDELCEHLNFD